MPWDDDGSGDEPVAWLRWMTRALLASTSMLCVTVMTVDEIGRSSSALPLDKLQWLVRVVTHDVM